MMNLSIVYETLQVILLIATTLACENHKPHIVLVLVDDWGWANVGYHLSSPTPEVDTPNIDSLVEQGLELDQHYASNVCSPSRCSLLSGRLPIHVNDRNRNIALHNSDDPVSGYAGIPRQMTTLGTKMKQGGYATHVVGKWNVGMATADHTPKGRGFDSSLIYFSSSNDYYTQQQGECDGKPIVDLWDSGRPARELNGTGYEEGLFRDRILDIVNNHLTETPLFLYYAPHIVHSPLDVPDSYLSNFDFIENDNRQRYMAMVKYFDDVIGELTDALKDKGMWNNTLLVLSSDNGGSSSAGNNHPLKGTKGSDWQGGIRVNAFVSGGFLPESMREQKTEGYIHLADWYATFSKLAGVDPTDEVAASAGLPAIDSLDMWPLISGQNSTSPRTDIPISLDTLISGDYKILTGTVSQAGWTESDHPNGNSVSLPDQRCKKKGCLYHIKDDPEERNNLASTMKSVLREMRKKLKVYQSTHFDPDRGSVSPEACAAALGKYEGFWGPFTDL